MKIYKTFFITSSLCFALIISGVYATWEYANGIANDKSHDVLAAIDDWYYEENLPGGGDDEEAEDAFDDGISHAGIIQDIIEDISLFDPNNSHDSQIIGAIEGAIEDEKYNGDEFDHNGVGSSTKYNGVTLRDFAGSRGYENLGFFIYYGEGISDVSEITRIEIYTYTLSDTTNRVGTYIEAYKTIATLRDGQWILSGGHKGEAPIVVYGSSNTTGKYKNVVDATKWRLVE